MVYLKNSGYRRTLVLIVLVLEFESHRGEILFFFCINKYKRRDELVRAPTVAWVGGRNSTRADQRRKGWSRLAIQMQGASRSGRGGRRPCWVTPDLSYGQAGRKEGRKYLMG